MLLQVDISNRNISPVMSIGIMVTKSLNGWIINMFDSLYSPCLFIILLNDHQANNKWAAAHWTSRQRSIGFRHNRHGTTGLDLSPRFPQGFQLLQGSNDSIFILAPLGNGIGSFRTSILHEYLAYHHHHFPWPRQ